MILIKQGDGFFLRCMTAAARHLANAIKVASLALGNFAFDKATRDQARDDIEKVMY
jgi:hypothetical protein